MTSNLTRDEAVTRSALLTVASYQVDLDLTAGEEVFRSVSVVSFECSAPGSATLHRPDRARGPRDHPERHTGRPGRLRRRPDRADRAGGRERAAGGGRLRLLAQRRGPAPVHRPGRRAGLPVLAPGDVRRAPGLRLLRPARPEGGLRAHGDRARGLAGGLQLAPGVRASADGEVRRWQFPATPADLDLHHGGGGRAVPRGPGRSTTASRWACSAASRWPSTSTPTRSSK